MSDQQGEQSTTANDLTKSQKTYQGLSGLSLGISMVVAILFGVGIGLWLRSMFGEEWLLWLGVFWGIGGAVLNVYKAYKKEQREYDKIAQDPKYQNHFDDSE
jgi:F0F1-type ATP synthase assembly protein I